MIKTTAIILWTLAAPIPTASVTEGAAAPILQTTAVCPAHVARAERPIVNGITRGRLAQFRSTKLAALTPADVRPLQDADACGKLDAYYTGSYFLTQPWKRSYFKVGDYYVASFYYEAAKGQRVRRGHYAIFNKNLTLLTVLESV